MSLKGDMGRALIDAGKKDLPREDDRNRIRAAVLAQVAVATTGAVAAGTVSASSAAAATTAAKGIGVAAMIKIATITVVTAGVVSIPIAMYSEDGDRASEAAAGTRPATGVPTTRPEPMERISVAEAPTPVAGDPVMVPDDQALAEEGVTETRAVPASRARDSNAEFEATRPETPVPPTLGPPETEMSETPSPQPELVPAVEAPAPEAATESPATLLGNPSTVPAAAPGPAAPAAEETETIEASVSDEAAILERALSAIQRGKVRHALAWLRRHRQLHPGGTLAQERDAAQVTALCALGRVVDARRARASFDARWPGSALVARLNQSCAETLGNGSGTD